ncbi:MAG: hypothetical protein CMJ48_04445 [Planctomycetaceae bacterium]|nr:hypothetical protein [Planctomycetaceae bacterium]
MNFALLGDDPGLLPIVRAISESPDDRLSSAALCGELQETLMTEIPGLRFGKTWDELLADLSLDVVLIGGNGEDVLEGARRLAGEGTSLLVVPRTSLDATFAYEMSLIRDDSHVVLMPAFLWRFDGAIGQFQTSLQENDVGKLLHLQLERHVSTVASNRLSPEEIDNSLLNDCELLRCLGGNYSQVTALRSSGADETISMQTVTLAGNQLPEATWIARPGAWDRWKLTASTERGTLELSLEADEAVLERIVDARTTALPLEPRDDACERLLETLKSAVAGKSTRPNWHDLTRAFEIVEAAHRSIRRRRTIDLHFETTSERTQFKTQMTALGCGVLSYLFFGLIAYLLVGELLDVGERTMKMLRIVWFAPVIVYLALQFLLVLARPASQQDTSDS